MSSWAVPEEAEVARTLSAVGEPALRRLFFSELENPEWLAPLAKLGVFTDPGVVESEEGYRAWPWPEGDYLLRVAPERPAEVTALLKQLADSDNPWVQRALVEIAAVLPTTDLVALVPAIVRLLASRPDRVDEMKVASLVERLLDEGRTKDARRLLSAMFSPTSGDEEEMAVGSRRRSFSSIDDYWYRELLTRLTPRFAALGLDGLKLAAGWLMRAVKIRADGMPEFSHGIWRPSIGPHDQNTGLDGIDDALIDAVRDVGIAVTLDSATREAIDFLNSRGSLLMRRIGVEVAASAAGEGGAEVLAAGYEMLRDDSLLDLDVRPEYAHLAQVLVPRLTRQQLDEWARFILSGTWLLSDDHLRRIAAWPDGDPGSVGSDQIGQQKRRLTHRLLSSFSAVLTGELAEKFTELDAEFGEVSHPEFTGYVESFTGPNSPLTPGELAAMTARETASYLTTWTPQQPYFGPSVLGLARALETVVAATPARFEELRSELSGMKSAYVRAVVSGWAEAAKGGYRPSSELWDDLAQLANHERNEVDLGETIDHDDDLRWQWVHQSLVSLAAAVVDGARELDQLEASWRVLKSLSDHFDPTPAHEERYGGSNMDPLTLSLNTVRPAALRAAFHLFTALTDEGSPEAIEHRLDVLTQLSLHVGPSHDPSLAVAAVLGEGIGRIWNVDENWVTGRVEEIAGAIASPNATERAWADVVVSVALRVYRPGPAVLRMMRPALQAVFSPQYAAYAHTVGWRDQRSTIQTAASHIIWTVALGAIQLNDPLVTAMFSGTVNVDDISEAIGHLGWQLMRIASNKDQHPPEEFLALARALVESRLTAAREGSGRFEELSHFHWWIKSDVFEIDWWLPILGEIVERGVSLDKTFIGQALEQAAQRDPATTITIFERLVDGVDYWQRYDLMQHAAKILTPALKSGNQEAVTRARSMMDTFAREGHFGLIDQIERLMLPAET